MFHEVRMNSYSIDAIFGEDSGTFSQPEIIGLVQSFPERFSPSCYLCIKTAFVHMRQTL